MMRRGKDERKRMAGLSIEAERQSPGAELSSWGCFVWTPRIETTGHW